MDSNVYEHIQRLIIKETGKFSNKKDLFDKINVELEEKFNKQIKHETFTSIYSSLRRRQMFKSSANNWRKLKDNSISLSTRYSELAETNSSPNENILIRMSRELSIAPVLAARLVLDGLQRLNRLELAETPPKDKMNITDLLKGNEMLKNGRLSSEILEACFMDEDYGPTIDLIKNLIGLEYEFKLENILKELNIVYVKETELREKGFDKTPDFKLDIPICLSDGTIISWIDSKATFGDEQSHSEYYETQFKFYLNRFGSGLVIYWFGYLESVRHMYSAASGGHSAPAAAMLSNGTINQSINGNSNVTIVIMDRFPLDIIQLDNDLALNI